MRLSPQERLLAIREGRYVVPYSRLLLAVEGMKVTTTTTENVTGHSLVSSDMWWICMISNDCMKWLQSTFISYYFLVFTVDV